jgi:predicted GNAT family N-acyltransferase
MGKSGNLSVRVADWTRDANTLRAIREQVFVLEQAVPPELEWDGIDPDCVHVLAELDGEPVGTGRLLPDGHIGRMAVLRAARSRGVGAAMMVRLVELARARGLRQLALNAQTHAIPFYRRFGFTAVGPEFDDAGMPHVRMTRALG